MDGGGRGGRARRHGEERIAATVRVSVRMNAPFPAPLEASTGLVRRRDARARCSGASTPPLAQPGSHSPKPLSRRWRTAPRPYRPRSAASGRFAPIGDKATGLPPIPSGRRWERATDRNATRGRFVSVPLSEQDDHVARQRPLVVEMVDGDVSFCAVERSSAAGDRDDAVEPVSGRFAGELELPPSRRAVPTQCSTDRDSSTQWPRFEPTLCVWAGVPELAGEEELVARARPCLAQVEEMLGRLSFRSPRSCGPPPSSLEADANDAPPIAMATSAPTPAVISSLRNMRTSSSSSMLPIGLATSDPTPRLGTVKPPGPVHEAGTLEPVMPYCQLEPEHASGRFYPNIRPLRWCRRSSAPPENRLPFSGGAHRRWLGGYDTSGR